MLNPWAGYESQVRSEVDDLHHRRWGSSAGETPLPTLSILDNSCDDAQDLVETIFGETLSKAHVRH